MEAAVETKPQAVTSVSISETDVGSHFSHTALDLGVANGLEELHGVS